MRYENLYNGQLVKAKEFCGTIEQLKEDIKRSIRCDEPNHQTMWTNVHVHECGSGDEYIIVRAIAEHAYEDWQGCLFVEGEVSYYTIAQDFIS